MNIRGFHAHVYFDAASRPTAERVYESLAKQFEVRIEALYDQPVGPHAKPMFQINLEKEQFASVVPWLMMNRGGLSVLVHPNTDDPVADHDTNPLWMGEPLPVDVEIVRHFVQQGGGVLK